MEHITFVISKKTNISNSVIL